MPKIILQSPLDQPNGKNRLLGLLRDSLHDDAFDAFQLMVAFAKQGPLKKLAPDLQAWKAGGKSFDAIIGLDENGTSYEALQIAMDVCDSVHVVHGKSSFNATFHPKIYVFRGTHKARLIYGSNNLTVGGSEINAEAFVCMDLTLPTDAGLLSQTIDSWNDLLKIARVLDGDLLTSLKASGMVLSEQELRSARVKTQIALAENDTAPDTRPEFEKVKAKAAESHVRSAQPTSPTPADVPTDWQTYGDFLESCSQPNVNLYWSIGKKNNRLDIHMWAIDFMIKNFDIYDNNDERSLALQEASAIKFPNHTMEGIRALLFSRLIGLIKSTYPEFETTEAYQSLQLNAGQLAYNAPNRTTLTNQLEKLYFWNDLLGKTNRHLGQGGQIQTHELFHIYPVIFIYQVLLRLTAKGQSTPSLTKFEIEKFVVLARDHTTLDEITDRIINFRAAPNHDEIHEYLREKAGAMDTRFYAILQYCKYLTFTQDIVALKPEYVDQVANKVAAFTALLQRDQLLRFEKNGAAIYRDMLGSSQDIISYHNSNS